MKRKQWIQRTAAMVLCLLLCLSGMRTAASASETNYFPPIPDLDSLCSLTLYYSISYKDPITGLDVIRAVSDVPVRVYRVADVSSDVEFTATENFAKYPVKLNGLDQAGWRKVAETLGGYVVRDKIEPVCSDKSDEDGYVRFEDMPVGLYLVMSDRFFDSETDLDWEHQPFMICMPNRMRVTDSETKTDRVYWDYNVSAKPKSDSYTKRDGEVVMRKVLKVWNDDGYEYVRPTSITVELLKDGEVYDTVVLSAENNWRWTWEELDADAKWRVVEVLDGLPDGYAPDVPDDPEGVTFVITNTYNPPDNPPPPPPPPPPPEEPPDEPPPEEPPDDPPDEPPPETPPEDPPDEPPSVPPPPDEEIEDPPVPTSNNEEPPEDLDEPPIPLARLPQTGQLWWPVPLLAMGGMMMLLLGLIFFKRSRSDEA